MSPLPRALCALVLCLSACPDLQTPEPRAQAGARARPASSPISQLRAKPLGFTRHARCRMDCRHISEAEVKEILGGAGKLDPSRTRTDGRCPSYALEGRTSDGQQVRIVYGACEDETAVITTIDLGRDWPCGDC